MTNPEMEAILTKGGISAEDVEKIGEWISGAQRYFLQPFTDRDTVPNRFLSAPEADDLRLYREIAARYVVLAEIRGLDE